MSGNEARKRKHCLVNKLYGIDKDRMRAIENKFVQQVDVMELMREDAFVLEAGMILILEEEFSE